MNDVDISKRLQQFVEQQFPLARKRGVAATTPLLTNGIIDSMGTMDLVMFMESEFNIVVSDDDMLSNNFETLQNMTDFVHGKIANSLA